MCGHNSTLHVMYPYVDYMKSKNFNKKIQKSSKKSKKLKKKNPKKSKKIQKNIQKSQNVAKKNSSKKRKFAKKYFPYCPWVCQQGRPQRPGRQAQVKKATAVVRPRKGHAVMTL
jgi:hypothetical protein